jgi:membrane protein
MYRYVASKIRTLVNFLTRDIWRLRLRDYPRSKSFFIRQLRIIILAVRGYNEDKCKFRASALTFYTLLSIVPIIAMIFGIAKGFGLEKRVEKLIMDSLPGQEEVATRIMAFANSLLANAQGGLIAGIGIVILLWTVIKVLSNIEHSFNEIWGVKTPRSYVRKFSDYLSMMLVCPILLVLASSLTVVVSSQITQLLQRLPLFSSLSSLVSAVLKLLPYCSLWVVFTFVFIFMPNTKVRFVPALLAGVVAGTAFQIAQWAYINFQIGVARYSAIYGSFAALPLFLLWLQISWLIVLFGAELSFAHQNVETYELEQESQYISPSFKRLLSLLAAHLVVKRFVKGEKPLGAPGISQALDIPVRLTRQIVYELVEAGIFSEVRKAGDKEAAYQPALDVERLTIQYVIEALERRGGDHLPIATSKERKRIAECLNSFGEAVARSPANVALKNI